MMQEVGRPHAGPNQLLVQVLYAGICGSDIHIEDADIALKVRPPVVMGHEYIGRVHDVGEGVEGWSAGDLVVSETAFHTCGTCLMCMTDHDNVCADKQLIGYYHNGAFAPFMVIPATRAHHISPTTRSSERSLALCEPLAGVIHGLHEQAKIVGGERIVIAGPGTVGLLSVQVAIHAGAEVMLVGRSVERLALGAKLGAHRTVNSTTEDVSERVAHWTDGRGADLFVECAGSTELPALGLEVLRRRGRYLQQGLVGAPVMFPIDLVAYKELQIVGTLGQKRSAWKQACELVSTGAITLDPLVTDIYSLTNYEAALNRVRRHAGVKTLLQPEEADY
jgi:L-iditol 2-dehydrogenase